MSNVTPMPGTALTAQQTQKPNQEIIEFLKDRLSEAEEGQLQGMMFIGLHSNDETSHMCEVPTVGETYKIVGAATDCIRLTLESMD